MSLAHCDCRSTLVLSLSFKMNPAAQLLSMLSASVQTSIDDPNAAHKSKLLAQSEPSQVTSIIPLLHEPLDSLPISKYLTSLYVLLPEDQRDKQPDKRSYPGACFFNHYPIGISLCYTPSTRPASCCQQVHGELTLETVDIFNPAAVARPSPTPAPEGRKRHRPPPPTYSTPPHLPFSIHLHSKSEPFTITASTTGSAFVSYLGEPARKGGGQGWMGIWVEWRDLQVVDPRAPGEKLVLSILIELQDPKGEEWLSEDQMRRGAGGIWERSANWKWANLKVFVTS